MMHLSLLKKCCITAAHSLSALLRSDREGLLVVTYHRVTSLPDYGDPLKVSVSVFEQQIRFLRENFRIISTSDLAAQLGKGNHRLNDACLITFDDGWRDNYLHAFPVLVKLDVSAIFFLASDYIGTERIFWPERLVGILNFIRANHMDKLKSLELKLLPTDLTDQLHRAAMVPRDRCSEQINDLVNTLKRYDAGLIHRSLDLLAREVAFSETSFGRLMMNWDEVRTMVAQKMEFGSHTRTHAILTQIKRQDVFEELLGSKMAIEEQLNRPVKYISYPNGDHDAFVLQKTHEAGYEAGFTCIAGRNQSLIERYALKRKHVTEYYSVGINGRFANSYFGADLSDFREKLRATFRPRSSEGGW